GELVHVLLHPGGLTSFLRGLAAVVARRCGIEDRRVEQAPSVDGIDRNLAAGEQIDGIAEFIARICSYREWIGKGGIRKDADRKRPGEPDEVLAPGNAREITRELAHRIQGVLEAKLGLVGLGLG